MSIEALAVVLHHSKASGTDKLVLVGIANHDGDGGAWPSIQTLAKYANVHPRTVSRSIANLIQLGELTSEQNGAPTRYHNRPNLYQITLRCPSNCDGTKAHRIDRDDMHVTPTHDASVTPPMTPVSSEPSVNHQKKSRSLASRIPDDFALTDDMRAWAAEKRPDVDLELATEMFVNYWRAKSTNATKLDWVATWRNWVLKEKKSPQSLRINRAEQKRASIAELRERLKREEMGQE